MAARRRALRRARRRKLIHDRNRIALSLLTLTGPILVIMLFALLGRPDVSHRFDRAARELATTSGDDVGLARLEILRGGAEVVMRSRAVPSGTEGWRMPWA